MMTLGVTGAFGFADFPQPRVLAEYVRAGCRVLQVYRNRVHEIAATEILRTVRDLPLRVDSMHGHFGDDLDPSSTDESVRAATVEVYRREADYCRQLGGELVVVHPCPIKSVEGPQREACFAALRRSFADLARIGESTQVRFAFENLPTPYAVGADVARLVREVTAAASPHIVFLLDTGHAHITGTVPDAIRAAGGQLRYTHVHDNDGVNDLHLLPGRGSIDWDATARALHEVCYSGVFLLEVFEPLAELPTLLSSAWTERFGRLIRGA
ncbi:MAG: sugar phosphate isomerase/epimerase family protein [Phycisphaerae bacterium]